MTSALGNVNVAPGFVTGDTSTAKELLASSIGYSQDGVTLRVGQGVLEVGTPLVEHEDQTFGPLTAAGTDRTVSPTVTFTDSGDLVTTTAPHELEPGDEVKVASVSGTTGITANTVYYVKTTPSATTLTLSTTNGGSTLALTTDGTGGALTQAQTAGDVSGFLRDQVDTGQVGDIPKLGNRVYKGEVHYDVVRAANGGALSAASLTALGARVDTYKDTLIF